MRLERLHLQSNSVGFTAGQTVMENITFRPNNIRRVDNVIPDSLVKRIRQMFPGMAEDMEALPGSFSYNSVI